MLPFLLISFLFQYALAASGTTLTLDGVATGRCLDKLTTSGTFSQSIDLSTFPSCDVIWSNFTQAFVGHEFDALTSDNFQPFLAATKHYVPVNKSLFWTGSANAQYNVDGFNTDTSGTQDIVHDWANNGKRFWTLEDSLYGGMMNNLQFCGASLYWQGNNNSIFNFSQCPSYGSNGSNIVFWTSASAQFAAAARGDLTMLAYAGTQRIYRNGSIPGEFPSIFASVEIKNLNAAQITSFTLYVLPPSANFSDEKCGSGSVVQLMHDLTAIAGIPAANTACEDNPPTIRHLLCVDNPTADSCLFWDQKYTSGAGQTVQFKGLHYLLAVIISFVGVLFLI